MAPETENRNDRWFGKRALVVAVLAVVAACAPHTFAEPFSAGGPDGSGSSSQHGGADSPRSADDVVYRVDTDDPVVFLTVDDGATRDPNMADILNSAGTEATLFLTDQYVRQDPGFFESLRDDAGARIENHTIDHPDLASEPFEEQRRQICSTSDHYEEEFGRRPTLLRPPYGSFNDDTLRAATECGVTHVVHWSAVLENGEMQFAVGDELRPGDIVLMHFSEQFQEDVNRFIDEANRAGLEPASLENYLN